MRGISTLRKALCFFLTSLALFCQLTVSAQCPTGNCGSPDATFATNNGGFSSTDFQYSTSPGGWIRTGLAPNASYSITSPILATGNASIANIGFALFGNARDDINGYTINIRDANTNTVIAQCLYSPRNPSVFDTTASVCVAIPSTALQNRNIRIEFVLIADENGTDQDLRFGLVRWEFTQTTGIPSGQACPGGVTEDFDNGPGDFITNTTDIIYNPGTAGDGFFTIPDAPGTDRFDNRTLSFTSGRYQVSATGTTVVTGFSYENGGLVGNINTLVINILSDNGTILASTTLENDDDEPFLDGSDFCITIRDLDLPGQAIRVQFVFNTGEDAAGFFNFDDFRINLPQAITPPPLPVEFISFTARKADNGVQLLWTVGTEVNVDRYEIERSSDGINFTKVGSTPATASSSYSFTDIQPLAGVAYYRVRNVDHDGQYAYTTVLKYNNGQVSGVVKVFPTLTKGQVTFQHPSVTGKATISILNQEGKTLRTLTLSRGAIATPVDLSTYPSGTYLLRYVEESGQPETFRIFKQ